MSLSPSSAARWRVAAGAPPAVFATPWGRIGVAICYDIEHPPLARAQAEAGAWLVLVPTDTDTIAGFNRVRLAARAAALSNQCYVALATTVGDAPFLATLDVNRGYAAVFGPIDRGFPDDGIIARSELDAPGWLYVDLDPAPIARRARARCRSQPQGLSGSTSALSGRHPMPLIYLVAGEAQRRRPRQPPHGRPQAYRPGHHLRRRRRPPHAGRGHGIAVPHVRPRRHGPGGNPAAFSHPASPHALGGGGHRRPPPGRGGHRRLAWLRPPRPPPHRAARHQRACNTWPPRSGPGASTG